MVIYIQLKVLIKIFESRIVRILCADQRSDQWATFARLVVCAYVVLCGPGLRELKG